MSISDDPLYKEVRKVMEGFKKRMIERIERVKQQQEALKSQKAIESQIFQERKANAQLKAQLAELTKQSYDFHRICNDFSAGLTISDGDQERLNNAKEMYKIGKHLTGVRFDFSAPPDIAKGYIKSDRRRALRPFKESAATAPERLWTLLEDTCQSPAKQEKKNVKYK